MCDPSGLQATLTTASVCPLKTMDGLLVFAPQIRAVLSIEVVRIRDASGLQATLVTKLVCPARTVTRSPVSASQIVAVLPPAITMEDPSGLHAAFETVLV
jgi:hypothetical protein